MYDPSWQEFMSVIATMSNQKTEFQRTPRHLLTFDFTLESLKDSLKDDFIATLCPLLGNCL